MCLLLVQPALQDEPRRSRGVWEPSLAEPENGPKIGPTIRPDFRYPARGAGSGVEPIKKLKFLLIA